ncbi:MAG: hypothetical protein QXI58_02305 [Candidatus Micrarchaeia archaeon]
MREKKFKLNYKLTILAGILIMLIALISIKFVDDMRFQQISKDINLILTESESSKLISMYPSIFEMDKEKEREKFCKYLDFNTKLQMDKSFRLVNLLKIYEQANLLSDYEIIRKRYFLSNVELYYYTLSEKKYCNESNVSIILFFHYSEKKCPECIVQGQILDKIREKCSNVKIITLSIDLDIIPIELLKSRYNITDAPSLVIDDNIVIRNLVTEEEILNKIVCE